MSALETKMSLQRCHAISLEQFKQQNKDANICAMEEGLNIHLFRQNALSKVEWDKLLKTF